MASADRPGRSACAARGALDGEVAFLAGQVTKQMLFSGGALAVAGTPDARAEAVAEVTTPARQKALEGYLESIVKAVATLAISAPSARSVVLSGGSRRLRRSAED